MKLSLTPAILSIQLEWYERLWAFHWSDHIDIPLDHIQRATTTEPLSEWKEIRAPGTFLPGLIKAGTYYTPRGREFWYVIDNQNYLVLELVDEYYKRVVLTIPDSSTWVERLSEGRN